MKVLNSYIPASNNAQPILFKWQALGLALSSVLAKKHYNQVELYTSQIMMDKISRLDLPYDKINVVDDELINNIGQITVPKVAIMSAQEEPFMHIDFDTFIYKKLDESKLKGITFSHRDIPPISSIAHLCGVYDSYGSCYQYMKDILPNWYYDIDIRQIPNMNLVYIPADKLEVFREACNTALSFYYPNKDRWNSHPASGIGVEQLGVYAALKHKGEDVNYYFNDVPSAVSSIDNVLEFHTNSDHTDKHIKINLNTEPEKLIEEDFGGYIHTSSFWLSHPGIELMCRLKLKYEGYQYLVDNIDRVLE